MKKINLLLISVFSLTIGFGQINFEFVYSTGGFDKAEAIVQTYDSGYAVIGSTEGFIGLTDIYLMRTDKYGLFQWSKTFGGLQIDHGYDIVETTDSGFAIVGYTNSYGTGGYDILFIKTDKNGDTIFTKTIGEIGWDFGYAIKQTSDGGYIIAGETHKSGNSKAYAVRLDAAGNTTWKKTFGGTQNDKFEDVIITSTGSFVFAGETESYGNGRQAYVVKINNSGVISWQKAFGNPGINFAKSIVELPNSDLVFAGGTNTPPFQDIDNWIVKINSLGVLKQENYSPDYSTTYPFIQNDDWNECVEIYKGDSLFFGGNRSYESWESGNVFAYLNTSNLATGLVFDFQKYISTFKESIQDIKSTNDNGVIYACTGENLGTGGSSIYLIKMDGSLTLPYPYPNSIFRQDDISSIQENEQKTEVNFYPNPVSNIGNFKIKMFNNKNISIIIKNISGQIMVTKEYNSTKDIKIDFSKLSNGVYFATIEQNNIVLKTKKIIVSK